MEIKTVLCPIDFSSCTDYEIELATEVCETFGARLVLTHNLAAAAPGMVKAWEWEWEESHKPEMVSDESAAQERLQEVLKGVPGTVQAEARLSRGPVGLIMLHLIEELAADLVVLGCHGWSSEEHASLSERIIEKSPCPVLTFEEGRGEHPFRLRVTDGEEALRAVVPTDFSESAQAAVAYACDLARSTALELHLVNVCASDQETDVTRGRLAKLVPSDLEGRVEWHAVLGTVGDGITTLAKDLDAELIVMGEHAPGFLRRYFTHDTARELLHRARCPVWHVPWRRGG